MTGLDDITRVLANREAPSVTLPLALAYQQSQLKSGSHYRIDPQQGKGCDVTSTEVEIAMDHNHISAKGGRV